MVITEPEECKTISPPLLLMSRNMTKGGQWPCLTGSPLCRCRLVIHGLKVTSDVLAASPVIAFHTSINTWAAMMGSHWAA